MSAPNDPKMTLNTKRRNVHRMYPTTTPESQMPLHFAIWSTVFELMATSRQVLRTTPKWHWTLKGTRYLIYVLLVPPRHKIQSILLHGQVFSRYQQQKTIHQMKREQYEVKGNPMYPTTTPLVSNVNPLQATLRKVHLMTPRWPWAVKGQRYPKYVMFYYPEVPTFNPFRSTPSRFKVTGHFVRRVPCENKRRQLTSSNTVCRTMLINYIVEISNDLDLNIYLNDPMEISKICHAHPFWLGSCPQCAQAKW